MLDFPKVSLLVAMRDESTQIAKCIKSILAQDYPSDKLEILVMDGDSQDGSVEIVEHLFKDRPNCRLLHNPQIIQSAAWNLGIQHSTGEIISIVSGHVELDKNYVSKAVETLLRTGVEMVGGTVRAYSTGNVGAAIALAMSIPFGVGSARFRYTDQEEFTDTVFMGFCQRSIYQRMGGFDEEMVRNQDDEFSYRLQKAGGKIICNPVIVSYYYNRASFSGLWRQYFQYGYWKVRVLQKHPLQMSLRQFAPPLFVLALTASAGFAFSPFFLPLAPVVPLLYILANLVASVWTAFQRGWKHLWFLPFVFAILHLSYGVGFLVGLLKFWNRWGDSKGSVPVWSNEPAE